MDKYWSTWVASTAFTIGTLVLFWSLQVDGYLGLSALARLTLAIIPLTYLLYLLGLIWLVTPVTGPPIIQAAYRGLGLLAWLAITMSVLCVHLRYSAVVDWSYTSSTGYGVACLYGVTILYGYRGWQK